MVTVIGQENCMKCKMVERKLELKNINFNHVLLSEMDNREELLTRARAKGLMSFPIVIRDGELVRPEEVLV